MRGELELVNGIRSVMAPANPVPVGAQKGEAGYEADLDARLATLRSAGLVAFEQPERRRGEEIRPSRDGGRANTAWRLVAPALSGLAVIAVVVSLTLAGGSTGTRPSTSSAASAVSAPPRFYVTVNTKRVPPEAMAIVHSSLTGGTIASVRIPKSIGFYSSVAAARSDREFLIAADRPGGHDVSVAALYRLRLAANGHVLSFSTISTNLGLGPNNIVDGIALSPDGANLVAAVQIPEPIFPEAQLVVISLHGAPTRVWTTPEKAFAWDPTWTSNKDIAFLWQDHLKGPYSDFTGRTSERVLSTSAHGSNLLAARVLATASAKLGFIENAFAAPHGGPIIAAASKNVPTFGTVGKATVSLVALSPVTGKVVKVFGVRVLHYHNQATLTDADYWFGVFGLDATGRHALVGAPKFGMLSDGKFARLPGGPGRLEGAAW